MSGFERFTGEYAVQLEKAVREHPAEYVWPLADVAIVAAKMSAAFARKSYNKEGRAIRMTCKALLIAYTYRDINAYLALQEVQA